MQKSRVLLISSAIEIKGSYYICVRPVSVRQQESVKGLYGKSGRDSVVTVRDQMREWTNQALNGPEHRRCVPDCMCAHALARARFGALKRKRALVRCASRVRTQARSRAFDWSLYAFGLSLFVTYKPDDQRSSLLCVDCVRRRAKDSASASAPVRLHV